jgi:hypothetical protein
VHDHKPTITADHQGAAMTTPPETNANAWSAPTLISLANADHSAGGAAVTLVETVSDFNYAPAAAPAS